MPSKIVKTTGRIITRMITKTDLLAFAIGAALAIPALALFVTYLLGGL
jgi:hypothetical protein